MKRRTSLLLVLVAGLALAGTLFFTSAPAASAQGVIQCSATGTDELIGCNLCDLITTVNIAINIGAAALLGIGTIGIIVVGFLYITSASNPGLLQQAKSALIYAVTGMIIVILSFLIVKTIFRVAFNSDQSDLFNISCNAPDLGGGTDTQLPPGPGDPGEPPPSDTVSCQNSTQKQCYDSAALTTFINCFENEYLKESLENSEVGALGARTTSEGFSDPDSCHFGGRSCTDGGYAVDYEGNYSDYRSPRNYALFASIQECAPNALVWGVTGDSKKVPATDPDAEKIHIQIDNGACNCD